MLEGVGTEFAQYVDSNFRYLVYEGLQHPNRFVRETSYMVLKAAIAALGPAELSEVGEEIALKLRDGLSDNWSQVRLVVLVVAVTRLIQLITSCDNGSLNCVA